MEQLNWKLYLDGDIAEYDVLTKFFIELTNDVVDFKLVNLCMRGDIVVSQDYGVAAMALGKGR